MTSYEVADAIALHALLDAWERAAADIAFAKQRGYSVAATSTTHANGRIEVAVVVRDTSGRTSRAPIATLAADVAAETLAELIRLGASQ